jgi:hypothetical protein
LQSIFNNRLKHGSFIFRNNLRHVNPAEMKPFPEAGAFRENRRQKTRVRAVLTDTPVMAAFAAEAEAR